MVEAVKGQVFKGLGCAAIAPQFWFGVDGLVGSSRGRSHRY
ncbi:MAG: hypothetical protein VKJ64_09605 [Leptolyngbyaceae bacterium]|nr:hypothetical protein [Leptolyngbyaceae bacterium]